jgi:poly(hydroxyalkanoate) depolymerase family esterase
MNANFRHLMDAAARLTRAGDLRAATAAIQAALGLRGVADPTPADDGAVIIDIDAREVPDVAPPVIDGAVIIDIDAREVPDVAPPVIDEPASRPTRREPSRDADSFVAGHYANAEGRRRYKLYIPPQAGERPLPLVVMLHGCTQDPDDFAAGTAMNEAAREHGVFVLYPAQSKRVNPKGCWNWFHSDHQRRGGGEPAVLAGMTSDLIARHEVDPQRVYVAGMSAGGAMAAILGAAYPELYAAVGVHSGLAVGAASDLRSAFAAMKRGGKEGPGAGSGVPTIVFHGDADATVHPINGERVVAASAGVASSAQTEHLQTGGRRCTRRVHRTPDGRVVAEQWVVHGGRHAWSGGSANGSHTDPLGPDATGEMLRFFLEHPREPSRDGDVN